MEGLPQHLVYVPEVPMDVLGQVTQQGDRALVRSMQAEEQSHQAPAEPGVL